MKIEDCREGQIVRYRSHFDAEYECGVVIRTTTNNMAFVEFQGKQTKATPVEFLEIVGVNE